MEELEHSRVALTQLLGREPTSERIGDVRVGACLVEHHVAVREAFENRSEVTKELGSLLRVLVLPPGAEVVNPGARGQVVDDVVSAIAVMVVAVEDPDALYAICMQHRSAHHQPVEGAKPGWAVPTCVVKAGAGSHGDGAVS